MTGLIIISLQSTWVEAESVGGIDFGGDQAQLSEIAQELELVNLALLQNSETAIGEMLTHSRRFILHEIANIMVGLMQSTDERYLDKIDELQTDFKIERDRLMALRKTSDISLEFKRFQKTMLADIVAIRDEDNIDTPDLISTLNYLEAFLERMVLNGNSLEKEDIDITELVRTTPRFVDLHPSVELDLSGVQEPVHATIDQLRLREVLINIIVNANRAMKNKEEARAFHRVNAKELAFRAGVHENTARKVLRYDTKGMTGETYDKVAKALKEMGMGYALVPNILTLAVIESPPTYNEVRIRITDTGTGMTEATKSQIFDPFFTTEETGTGIGMFISNQIIKKHRGSIEVITGLGRGTTFIIRLPKYAGPFEPEEEVGEIDIERTVKRITDYVFDYAARQTEDYAPPKDQERNLKLDKKMADFGIELDDFLRIYKEGNYGNAIKKFHKARLMFREMTDNSMLSEGDKVTTPKNEAGVSLNGVIKSITKQNTMNYGSDMATVEVEDGRYLRYRLDELTGDKPYGAYFYSGSEPIRRNDQ